MTMTAGAAGACAKLAATNAMVEIAASMYRIRTSWELGGHHTSGKAKTEDLELATGFLWKGRSQVLVNSSQFLTRNLVFFLFSFHPHGPRLNFHQPFLLN